MDNAYCLGCGYSLTQLTEPRCPECGRAFDLEDPCSYARVRLPGPIARFLATPVGWPMHGLAVAASLLTLASCSVPGGYLRLGLLAFLFWLTTAAIWVFRGIARTAVLRIYLFVEGATVGRKGPWLIAPCLALGSITLCATGLPSACCFRLSRPAIDRLANEAAALRPGTAMPNRWVGLYHAEDITALPGGVRFLIRGVGFRSRGFARSTQALDYEMDGYKSYEYLPYRDGWHTCIYHSLLSH